MQVALLLCLVMATEGYFHSSGKMTVPRVSHLGSAVAMSPEDASILNPTLTEMAKPVRAGPLSAKIGSKLINMWGIVYTLSCVTVALILIPFMVTASVLTDVFGSPRTKKTRKVLDWFVHYWALMSLKLTGCNTVLYGVENLPGDDEAVIYVPNHTSFMDILILSGFVPKAFKYLSKEEIVKIPIIGYAMKLAQHVFLKRDDLKSSLEVTRMVVQKLKSGVSMVLFAEGTRSSDGVLKQFKKGAFQMAKDAQVKIVPISLGNLHRWMPPSALMPLGAIRNVYIKVHPAIETSHKTVTQIRNECWDAVNSGLPPYQQGVPSKRRQKKVAEEGKGTEQ